jgi:hypothetical protein
MIRSEARFSFLVNLLWEAARARGKEVGNVIIFAKPAVDLNLISTLSPERRPCDQAWRNVGAQVMRTRGLPAKRAGEPVFLQAASVEASGIRWIRQSAMTESSRDVNITVQ